MTEKVPMSDARRLCREVQERRFIKVFTQCWGCQTFSEGDIEKMCGGIERCNLVLRAYRREQANRAN